MSEVKRKLRNSKQADLTEMPEGIDSSDNRSAIVSQVSREEILRLYELCFRLTEQEKEVPSCKQGCQQKEETRR